MTDWYIDLYSSAGVKNQTGPIASASSWTQTSRMDRAGEFSFQMSGRDPMTPSVSALSIVRCFARTRKSDNTVEWSEIGSGIVQRVEYQVLSSGEINVTVSGTDMLSELNYITMGTQYYALNSPSAQLLHSIQNNINSTVNANDANKTWTIFNTTSTQQLAGRWNFESALQACIRLTELAQTHFAVKAFRELTWIDSSADSFPSSGIRAISSQTDLAAQTISIQSVSRVLDYSEIITRVAAFGSGNSDSRLSLLNTSLSPASPYAFETVGSYRVLRNSTAETTYGKRTRVVQFSNISPGENTGDGITASADTLYYATLAYLKKYESPAEFYEIDVAGALIRGDTNLLLGPLQRLLVIYKDASQNIDIHQALNILEVTHALSDDGNVTSKLLVSSIDRQPQTGTESIVEMISAGASYQSAPQLSTDTYVISFIKSLDENQSNTARFQFRLGNEIVQVVSIVFDFQLLALESTIKTISGTSSTTADSAKHSHSVPNHSHSFAISSGTVSNSVGFGAAGTAGNLVSGAVAAGTTFNYPTKSDTGASTSADGGEHSHTVTPNITTTYGVYRDPGGAFALADLEYSINGGTYVSLSGGTLGATSLGDGWWRLDLTSRLRNATTLRQSNANNRVEIRRAASGSQQKRATIEVQLTIRANVQSIV